MEYNIAKVTHTRPVFLYCGSLSFNILKTVTYKTEHKLTLWYKGRGYTFPWWRSFVRRNSPPYLPASVKPRLFASTCLPRTICKQICCEWSERLKHRLLIPGMQAEIEQNFTTTTVRSFQLFCVHEY